ncbi:hypothetical protein BDV10DRAFT_187575 [Aspergillus recurvatus]
MGLPYSVPKAFSGLGQDWNRRYQRVSFLKLDTGTLQYEYVVAPQDPQTEKCHLSWRNATPNQQQRGNPLQGDSEPRGNSLWAAPDSEIDEVDRIV